MIINVELLMLDVKLSWLIFLASLQVLGLEREPPRASHPPIRYIKEVDSVSALLIEKALSNHEQSEGPYYDKGLHLLY